MNKQNNSQSTGKKKKVKQPSVLESLKDLGTAPARSLKQDVFEQGGRDMMSQIFGPRIPQVPRSGEISAGESVEMNDILTGKHESETKLKNQIAFERRLRQEEQELRTKKSNELRLQLQAVMEEVVALR